MDGAKSIQIHCEQLADSPTAYRDIYPLKNVEVNVAIIQDHHPCIGMEIGHLKEDTNQLGSFRYGPADISGLHGNLQNNLAPSAANDGCVVFS